MGAQIPGDRLLRETTEIRLRTGQNFARFRWLLGRAAIHLVKGQREMAMVHCEAAAAFAIANHCGLFSSPDLERLIGRIGRTLAAGRRQGSRGARPASPQTILHVCSRVMPIGGSSRFVWRWIQQDSTRRHSVVLTRQPRGPLPDALVQAVLASHGEVHRLDACQGGFSERANRLAELGHQADLVVLHTERDILPMLAFPNPDEAPPLLFVDHGDHKFRLGLASSSAVASLRETGMRLAQRRQDVCASRNVLLPTLVDPVVRASSREEAKRRLGLVPDSIVLLCVARRVKFRSVGDQTYADLHRPLLEADPRVVFLVLGAGDAADCEIKSDRPEARMILLRERADTDTFYEAADIYIDSFPFVSITSLLEAGCRGLPLVSYFPHPENAEIFGADMVGLTGQLVRATTLPEYRAAIAELIANAAYRRELGDRTKLSIEAAHSGPNWNAALERAYERARDGTPDLPRERFRDQPTFEDVDRLVPFVCAQGQSADHAIQEELRIYSPFPRVRYWLLLAQDRGPIDFIRRGGLRCFLPERAVRSLRHVRGIWRRRSASEPPRGAAALL